MFLSKPMLGTQLDWSNPLNDGLVLDLLMNEGHGNIVNDLSGHGNHGTLHGFDFPSSVTSGWNPGMDGVALTFDGVDDYIDCGNNPVLNLTKATTVDVVMKPNTLGGRMTSLGREANDIGSTLQIGMSDLHPFKFYIHIGGEWCLVQSTTIPSGGEWYHVVATYDGFDIKMYVNGNLEAATPQTGSIDMAADFSMLLGQAQDGTEHLNGAIARARILLRCMSAFEVMQTQIDPYGMYQQ